MKKSHQLARLNLVHFLLQFWQFHPSLVNQFLIESQAFPIHSSVSLAACLVHFSESSPACTAHFPLSFTAWQSQSLVSVTACLIQCSASSLACTAHFPVSFTAHFPVSSQSLSLAPSFVPWPDEKKISYEISLQVKLGSFIISQRQ